MRKKSKRKKISPHGQGDILVDPAEGVRLEFSWS